jgi:hypothetical protein
MLKAKRRPKGRRFAFGGGAWGGLPHEWGRRTKNKGAAGITTAAPHITG